jgi:hypothetical protein
MTNKGDNGMGCVLRVSGDDFAVDELLSRISLKPCHVSRKGQLRLGGTSRISKATSFNVVTSNSSHQDLKGQIDDTISFLLSHREDLDYIVSFPGVAGAELDFGIARRDVYVQNDYFPAELLSLAGDLGIGIVLSQYPVGDAPETLDQ